MRLLIVNNKYVDLDDNTAIGLDFQAYDLSDPANQKVTVSNIFTIPLTANNNAIFEFPGNPQTISKLAYTKLYCDYYIDSVQLIKGGTVNIVEVSDRITLQISERDIFWDNIKKYKWNDFAAEYLYWLAYKEGYPVFGKHFTGSYSDFLDAYINSTEHLCLQLFYGNLALQPTDGGYLESSNAIYLRYDNMLGGHFSAYCKSIFEFLEWKYSVNLGASDGIGIFSESVAKRMYVPVRRIVPKYQMSGGDVAGYYFDYDITGIFSPKEDTQDKSDKTLYDFIKSFMQIFNCVLQKTGSESWIIQRFSNIKTANKVDFSKNISVSPTIFSPFINNFKQNNYITYKSIYKGGDLLSTCKYIQCKNENIEAGDTKNPLISIDAYVPSFVGIIPYLAEPETFQTFEFFVDGGFQQIDVVMNQNTVESRETKILKTAAVLSLQFLYDLIEEMAEYPETRTIKKFLSITDVNNFNFFEQKFIDIFGGNYYVNKISGFNPDKSSEPSSIELIKIP